MIDLWKLLDKTCPGSIPPGIIFLPGEKLKDPSFGWAPKTWLSNEELEYPDPLSNMVGAAKLVPEGLLVQYPGFVLHAQNRASILRVNESSFHFPSDSTLLEWYGVELTGLRNNPPKGNEKDEKQLAIILCRPKPKEIPEIALLVEIEEKIVQRSFSDKHHHSVIYHVSYDQRVKIWRETNGDLLSKWRDYITASIDLDEKNLTGDSKREDKMICGEALDSDQRWYVGGRPLPDPPEVKPAEQEVKKVPAQKATEPGQIPVDSGQNRTSRPVVRGARRTGPMMMGGLGGPKGVSIRPASRPGTARPTSTAVAAAQHALVQTSEPSSSSASRQQYPVQHSDSLSSRKSRSRSGSAVSSASTTSQSTSTPHHRVGSSPSLAVQTPTTSPPAEHERSPSREPGSRIPVPKGLGKVPNGGATGAHANGSAK